MIGLLVVTMLLGSVYVFIPDIISIKSGITIKATRPGLHRMLQDKSNVAKWWPGKISNDSFYLADFIYTFNNGDITVLPVSLTDGKTNLSTSLFLLSHEVDSTQLEWVGTMGTSYNPIKRFAKYLQAKKINSDMVSILQEMQSFYSKPENIYGFEIKKELVVDSLLISTSGKCKGYPGTEFIYSLIDKLKAFVADKSAKETGYPMLNIGTEDSLEFEVKVAIPTDKLLLSSGNILQKKMLGRGDILVTEVKGGIDVTTKAFAQIQKYASDYQRVAPAIPFYSLITDRTKEPDSNKWITKIYFPVM